MNIYYPTDPRFYSVDATRMANVYQAKNHLDARNVWIITPIAELDGPGYAKQHIHRNQLLTSFQSIDSFRILSVIQDDLNGMNVISGRAINSLDVVNQEDGDEDDLENDEDDELEEDEFKNDGDEEEYDEEKDQEDEEEEDSDLDEEEELTTNEEEGGKDHEYAPEEDEEDEDIYEDEDEDESDYEDDDEYDDDEYDQDAT